MRSLQMCVAWLSTDCCVYVCRCTFEGALRRLNPTLVTRMEELQRMSAESLRGAKKDATWLHVYPAHEVFIKKNVLKFHAQAECSKCPVYRAFEIDGSMDNYSR